MQDRLPPAHEIFLQRTAGPYIRVIRIYDGKVRRPVDLLVVTLRIATNPFQLEIDKAQVVFALRDVRPQP